MQSKIISILLVSIGLLLALPAATQEKETSKKEQLAIQAKLKRVIDNYYALNWFNGIVLISNESNLLYRNATGYANWDYDVPNSLSTSYNIGMTTQVFTATAIMQLVAKGDIKTKGFLKDYMPELANQLKYPITIHQLLNHTSGLGNYYESEEYLSNFLKLNKIEDLIKIIVKQPMQNMPGYDLHPSPSNYVILAGLIEKVSGLSYETYITKNILEKSNMKNTKLSAWNERIINKATAYVGTTEDKPVVAANIWGAYPFGSEGLYCNIEDLWHFTQAFFNGQLLPAKYQNMMLRNYEYTDSYQADANQEGQQKMKEHDNGYSYGWRTKQYLNYKVIYHNSFLPGTNIEARTYDNFEERYTVILLSNLSTDKIFALANEVDKVICEPDYKVPSSRIAMLVQNTITYQGRDFLITHFDSLLQNSKLEMEATWQLNTLAWHYKEKGELHTAQQLFELNASYFPDELIVHESLGEIYLAQKDYEKAKSCFEKCLTYPINASQKESIEKTIANIEIQKIRHQQTKADQQLTALIKGNSAKKTNLPKKTTESKEKAPLETPTQTPKAQIKQDAPLKKSTAPPLSSTQTKESTVATPAQKTTVSSDETFLMPVVDYANEEDQPTSLSNKEKETVDIDKELMLLAAKAAPKTTKASPKNTPPQFPGGEQALEKYLINSLKLSPEVFATADKETVYVGFIVKKNGKLKNVKITKGLKNVPFYYKKEAIRLVENMPSWTPAYHKGRAVSSYQLLPIEFEKLFEQVK